MLERIKALVARWHELQEVEALSDRELGDLGMSRQQVRAFVRMPQDVPDRLAHMAAIFGLGADELQANHAAYVEALETCGTCASRSACTRVLGQGAAARPCDCGFCPNAPTFEALTEAA